MSCGSGNCGKWSGFFPLLSLAALALVGLLPPSAHAADVETRDFDVLVDGKPSGEVHMTIHRQDNGVIRMSCDTAIKVGFVVGKYHFIYRGEETWKDNRVVRFSSTTNDNGKQFTVNAVAEKDGLRITVNNTERMARPEVWLTSYWSLPDPKLRTGLIPLIDADTGKDLEARLNFVATEKRSVAGQNVSLNHYKLIGQVNIDLWYDGSERLIRQEWLEQGHRTTLELTRIRR
jgi:hypothetical protein